MSDPLAPAADRYERYYAEKLWEWIPQIHRIEDAGAAPPGSLRALIEVVSAQVAVARRSIDRLWDDAFIELCDDWAVPLIGELVANRPLGQPNRRARRVDTALTIYYRRRKGTPRVLEMLARDIGGWEGALVESFRRLARARHGLDPAPAPVGATGTPPGGWAHLDSPRVADVIDGPFDDLAHTPDVRRLRGLRGRYNISKLGLHLYRWVSYRIAYPTPVQRAPGLYTIDPSGRDVPLLARALRSADDCLPALEHEVPAPIHCRLLGEARFRFDAALVERLRVDTLLDPPAAAELTRYAGETFPSQDRLIETLSSLEHAAALLARLEHLLEAAMTEDSGRALLYPRSVALAIGADPTAAPIPRHRIAAANLARWGQGLAPPASAALWLDPERGRIALIDPLEPGEQLYVPLHHLGAAAPIGAGAYDRRRSIAPAASPLPATLPPDPGPVTIALPAAGEHQLASSRTYLTGDDLVDVTALTLQAADLERPYVVRRVTDGELLRFTISARPRPPGDDGPRTLVIDGLWLGIDFETPITAPPPCPVVEAELIIDGVWDRVVLRHASCDPGGERAPIDPSQCEIIPAVTIAVRDTVEELVLERCIGAAVREVVSTEAHGRIARLVIRDSILDARGPGAAIDTELGEVTLERVTIAGDVIANRLWATETIVDGRVIVTDEQHGCFRFSAARRDGSRTPPAFRSVTYAGGLSPLFVSRRFTDPGYFQLSEAAPVEITRGAENRGEMGAHHFLYGPLRADDLNAKLAEYAPFGTTSQLVFET